MSHVCPISLIVKLGKVLPSLFLIPPPYLPFFVFLPPPPLNFLLTPQIDCVKQA